MKRKLFTSFADFVNENYNQEDENMIGAESADMGAPVEEETPVSEDPVVSEEEPTMEEPSETEESEDLPAHFDMDQAVELDFMDAGKVCCGKVIGVKFDEGNVYYDVEITFTHGDDTVSTVIEMIDSEFVKETVAVTETESEMEEEIESEEIPVEEGEPSEETLEEETPEVESEEEEIEKED